MPSSRVMPQKALWFPARHLKERGWRSQTGQGWGSWRYAHVGRRDAYQLNVHMNKI